MGDNMVLRRYFLAYGPLYVKVVISSLILMIIGATIFQVGIYYVGVNFVLPPQKLFQPLPPPYSTYVLSDMATYKMNLTGLLEICRYKFDTSGYISIDITGPSDALIEVTLDDLSTGKTLYSLITHGGETITIPIEKPGSYAINMKPLNRGIVEVSIVISYYTLREKPEAIFAKWLQAMGLLIFGIGFLVFLASPLVAAKYAESAYSLAPKEIREELANLGIAQLHRNRMKETE